MKLSQEVVRITWTTKPRSCSAWSSTAASGGKRTPAKYLPARVRVMGPSSRSSAASRSASGLRTNALSMALHVLRSRHPEHFQAGGEGDAHGVRHGQPGRPQRGVLG